MFMVTEIRKFLLPFTCDMYKSIYYYLMHNNRLEELLINPTLKVAISEHQFLSSLVGGESISGI